MTMPSAQPQTPLDYALAYAARGWPVVPLHWITDAGACSCGKQHDGVDAPASGKGKHPHTLHAPHGVHSATTDVAVIRRWFDVAPKLNIGIACGALSGVVAVDIDPRDGGDVTWDDFLARNNAREPDTLVADTGGGGRHVLFAYAPQHGVRSPGKGIQIKGDGGYIVVEPSVHASGRRYAWSGDGDPLADSSPTLAPIPEWLRAPRQAEVHTLMRAPRQAEVHTLSGQRVTGYLDPQRIMDLRTALPFIDADDYTAWLQVGMALHSTGAPEAFEVWAEYSRRSPKYDERAQRAKWATFGARDGIHVESIFVWARDAGWNGESARVPVPIDQVRIAAARGPSIGPSELGLLELPGQLQLVVDFANRTAPKCQPAFAIGAALALGSVCTGRRYRALPRYNWPSLYFVHVGKSGAGKEHARTVIDAVLTAAEWGNLIGRSGYSSDSAVLSALLAQPAHIAIIDEIGALLGNMQAEGAYQARSAVIALTEAWGNAHGAMRPKAFSTTGLPAEQSQALMKRQVFNPALTLLGMTTPAKFYLGLGEGAIEGGFLPRLIVIETDIGRQPMGEPQPLDVPQPLVDWVHGCRNAGGARGNLAALDVPADMRPTPMDVPSDAAALRAFEAYERDVLKAMDQLDEESLAEVENRSVEKAMRVALILAVSSRVDAPRITVDHAHWAIAFVRYWTDRTVKAVRQHMHGSKFAAWQAEVLRVIQRGGEKGRTDRELAKASRIFDGLDLRQRRMVLDALVSKGEVALAETSGPSGRGRKRQCWVAIDQSDDAVPD